MRTLLTKFLILFFICSYSYSQSNTYNNQFKSAINFNENTNSPFTDVELNKLEQVYGSYLEKEILNRPSRVLAMKEILRNRVVIKLDNNVINHKPCPLLSEVSLFNAFVSNLKRDRTFDPLNFNPLKYNFEFHAPTIQRFRVDNSNYFIVIKPQNYNN
jgi:hypothetical protein